VRTLAIFCLQPIVLVLNQDHKDHEDPEDFRKRNNEELTDPSEDFWKRNEMKSRPIGVNNRIQMQEEACIELDLSRLHNSKQKNAPRRVDRLE
jgi:hypothetical protein